VSNKEVAVPVIGEVVSSDGKFRCTTEHAAEVAYMLSNCEARLHKHPGERLELGELLVRFLDGDEDVKSVNAELALWEREDAEEE
jgi:hypothetical protein